MPSADWDLEVALLKDYDRNRPAYKSRYFACLVGYSAVDNSVQDGVIIRYDRK